MEEFPSMPKIERRKGISREGEGYDVGLSVSRRLRKKGAEKISSRKASSFAPLEPHGQRTAR